MVSFTCMIHLSWLLVYHLSLVIYVCIEASALFCHTRRYCTPLTIPRIIEVENLKTGEKFEDDANILICARGNFNTPSYPDIPGLDTFKGEVMHSAKWNQESVQSHLQ
jgi:hypothetical protein